MVSGGYLNGRFWPHSMFMVGDLKPPRLNAEATLPPSGTLSKKEEEKKKEKKKIVFPH